MNDTLAKHRSLFPGVKSFIAIEPSEDFETGNGFHKYCDLLETGKKMVESGDTILTDHTIDMEKMCAILFTSGTMGTSKGVMLCQRNLTTATNSADQSMEYDDHNTFISCRPPYHT